MDERPRTVALVDDHHLMRSALASMVNSLGGYTVVHEAGHGRELMDLLEGAPDPDLAIVDLNMPVMDGYETLTWLRNQRPGIRALALTFNAADDALMRAVHAGARGFLLKSAQPEQLREALHGILENGYYQGQEYGGTARSSPDLTERERILAQISAREREFLKLVCSEAEPTYEEIADQLGVHRRTIDNYREGLFNKFKIKSKTGLVLFAMRWGVV